MPRRRRGNMSTEVRRTAMVEWLRGQPSVVTIDELIEQFDVSPATVRRDLTELSQSHKIVRVYGGATVPAVTEYSWREKAARSAQAKAGIGQYCATKLVHPGDTVFIDSGTTPAAVARALAARSDVTVMVGGLAGLIELSETGPQVIVLGGILRRRSASFLGQLPNYTLDHVYPDVAFLGAETIEFGKGANYPDLEQAIFKSRVIERCDRCWLVADDSKLRQTGRFKHWTAVEPPTGIVTNASDNPEVLERVRLFREAGCPVHVVGQGGAAQQG